MKVALLANLKQNAPTWPGMPSDQWDNLDSWQTVQSIIIALEKGGHHVTFLEGDKSLYNNLDAVKPDICFNICRGHFGNLRSVQVPVILELLRLLYTGSPILALALTEDRPMTKRTLIYHGLPTPAFQVFEREDEPLNARLHFPVRVKPNCTDTGLDIKGESIVYDQDQLRARLRCVIDRYHQSVLVEQHIEGRRITVGIVGNLSTPTVRQIPIDETTDRIFKGLHIFPPLEVDIAAFLTSKAAGNTKANPTPDVNYHCPAVLPENRVEDLKWLAAITFRVIGCLDMACIEFQLDANDGDNPYILNVNPLPSLNHDHSNLYIEAQADGWSYDQLIYRILQAAIERYHLQSKHHHEFVMRLPETSFATTIL